MGEPENSGTTNPDDQCQFTAGIFVMDLPCYCPPHKGLQLETRDVESLIEVREMLSARIKQWEKEIADKNLEKGLEKGRKEGLEKGEFIGEAKTLEKMLVLKFGSLPDWAEQRVAQANSTLLDQWIENLFDADNLENIFKSLSRSVKYFITPIVRQSYNSNIFSFDNTNACVLL